MHCPNAEAVMLASEWLSLSSTNLMCSLNLIIKKIKVSSTCRKVTWPRLRAMVQNVFKIVRGTCLETSSRRKYTILIPISVRKANL